ncbi:MAG: adenylosuccinate lyase [Bacteroidota bacterium]|jgi:adenylosuccinate lyase|nr:adenylosuccinate lyase [Bacteroidota bacterium]
MISRYTRPEMGTLWTDESKFHTWLEIEILACEAQAELGLIPPEAVSVIRERADFSVARINELEKTLNHDVIAFLTNVAENVGEESRFIHLGLTSSDIGDTALSAMTRRAGLLLREGMIALREVLAAQARTHKHTPTIGRTHGIHAEPMTFGLKLALWHEEMNRNIERMDRAIERISVGKLSGAVGTYANIDPFVETYVCERMGLRPSPISTQILQRDRHAEFLSTIAIVGGSLEKFATEIRHLQKTEVLEVEEFFAKGQKGSSAMPHKRNPITCERVAGMARLLRGYALGGFENQALWHERDITHSSVERVILPDATIALDYMLAKMKGIVENFLVYPEHMARNLNGTRGLIFSQQLLLALTRKGMLREDAYRIVQGHAMRVWREEVHLRDLAHADAEITAQLDPAEIDACFDVARGMTHVDMIFDRLGLGG